MIVQCHQPVFSRLRSRSPRLGAPGGSGRDTTVRRVALQPNIGIRLIASPIGFLGLALDRVHQLGGIRNPFATSQLRVTNRNCRPQSRNLLSLLQRPERILDHLVGIPIPASRDLPPDQILNMGARSTLIDDLPLATKISRNCSCLLPAHRTGQTAPDAPDVGTVTPDRYHSNQ